MKNKWVIAGGVLLFLIVTGILSDIFGVVAQLLAALLIALLPVIAIGTILWLIFGVKKQREKAVQDAQAASMEKLLSQFGETQSTRTEGIDRLFNERTGHVRLEIDQPSVARGFMIKCTMDRSLVSMSARDRETLRAILHIRNCGYHVTEYNSWLQATALIWGDGKATIYGGWQLDYKKQGDIAEAVRNRIIGRDGVEPSVNFAMKELSDAVKAHPDDPVMKSLASRLLGAGASFEPASALTAGTLENLPAGALIIGKDDKQPDKLWAFTGEGSLITIAPVLNPGFTPSRFTVITASCPTFSHGKALPLFSTSRARFMPRRADGAKPMSGRFTVSARSTLATAISTIR